MNFQNGQRVVVVSGGDPTRVVKVQSVTGADASRYPALDDSGVTGRDVQVQVVSGGDETRIQKVSGVGFSPLSLSPAAWFKLGTGITESGGAVSQWDDQSGNARHLKQTTGSAQPALQGDGTILFDGSSDFMKVTGGFTLAQPTTVAMVVKQVSWTSGDTIFDGNGGDSMRCAQNTASPRIAIYAGTAFDPFVTDLAVGAYGVLVAIFNGASSSLQIDANAADTGNAGASSGGGLTLGCNGNGVNQHSNIRVAEVCVFASAISGDDLTNLRAYLAAIRDAL